MTRLELDLLDAVTRKEIRAVLKTMDAIHAEHRCFLKQMNVLRRIAKTRLSK